MRRMVTSKQIDALNKIKINDDDEVVITSVDDEPVAKFYYEDAGASESLTVGGVHINNIEATPQIYGDGTFQIGDIDSTSSGAYIFFSGGTITVGADIRITVLDLPTSDPGVEGALWNDNGTLKISSGN